MMRRPVSARKRGHWGARAAASGGIAAITVFLRGFRGVHGTVRPRGGSLRFTMKENAMSLTYADPGAPRPQPIVPEMTTAEARDFTPVYARGAVRRRGKVRSWMIL